MKKVVKIARFEYSHEYPVDMTDSEILIEMYLDMYDMVQHLRIESLKIKEETVDD